MAKKRTAVRSLAADDIATLLQTLKLRFEANRVRHQGLEWRQVQKRVEVEEAKWVVLSEMERTGGEPDVVGWDAGTGELLFFDCAMESPLGRRSVCYDREGLESRKENRPENNAIDMAAAMGVELLDEEQYRQLQSFCQVDTKTSSWLKTPADIRDLGGALFGDCRYGRAFVYHNGAQSYYAVRGFRGVVRV